MKIVRTGQAQRRTNVREERKVIGTSGQQLVQIPAREKTNSQISPYCVPNEYICAEIGRYLRLPIVPGSITEERGNIPKYWYTVLDFGEEQPLSVANPKECIDSLPELCAGIVLFDILIANGDRTVNNLFFNKNFDPPELRLFDHEAALLGATDKQAEGRLTGSLVKDLGIPDHCLAPLVPVQDLTGCRWMKRIADLPDYLIEETCQDAAQYGMTPEETKTVITFLLERRHNLQHLVNEHKDKLGKGCK